MFIESCNLTILLFSAKLAHLYEPQLRCRIQLLYIPQFSHMNFHFESSVVAFFRKTIGAEIRSSQFTLTIVALRVHNLP